LRDKDYPDSEWRRQMTQLWNDTLAMIGRVASAAVGSRVALGALAAAIAGGVAAGLMVMAGSAPGAPPGAASRLNGDAGIARVTERTTIPVQSGWTLIATLRTEVPRYARAGGRPDGTVAATWYGRPSALPVIGQEPGWVRVRLVTRPNGSTAWLRSAGLSFSRTSFRLVVNLTTRHLQMLSAGRVVLNAPAGIGTGTDPTPAGDFFIAFYEQSLGAGYGPFILVTSAHSDTIANWEGSGDAVVGIHGPLGADIGANGVAVSRGCIRLPIRNLVRLAGLPAGTPITINA
jgi:hypothetical protein